VFLIGYQYINPTNSRAQTLRKHLKQGHDISEAVDDFKVFSSERVVVLLCLKQRHVVSHIAWGRVGQVAATERRKLNLDEVTEITPIDTISLVEEEPWSNYKEFFPSRQIFKNYLECSEFLEVLRNNFPEIDLFIRQPLEDDRLVRQLTDHERALVRLEQDAVEMVTRVADMTPRNVIDWSPTKQKEPTIKSFFSGIKKIRMSEDDIARWDVRHIPGYEILDEHVFGHYLLTDGKTNLLTFHANKNALENTIGVDLIYYSEKNNSFVLVQYKMGEWDGTDFIFRFPNQQLSEEISRMNRTSTYLDAHSTSSSGAYEYRINPNPFFLKFCPRDDFQPDFHEQVKGMIIPLDLWKMIENDTTGKFLGPREGKVLSFKNCPRYFDNTHFISMIKGGWIGTTSASSDFLQEVISELLDSNKSVIFATQEPTPEDPIKEEAKKKRQTKKRRPRRK
tara:strand:+ start:51 stop:1400 length:1350 start_codon:yes stop_codon:yes gene_type:complete